MSAVLEVEGLAKSFVRRNQSGRRVHELVVDDVAFSLENGKTLALVGESGAGKSTTARLVLRLIQPDRGSIRFGDRDLMRLSRKELRRQRQHMQMIFQNPYDSLDPRRRIHDSLAEPLKLYYDLNRADREQRIAEVLARVGLGAEHLFRLPHELSGGQLQRVCIARALSVRPSLIVCDEAVAALDVSVRAQVLNLLLDIQETDGVAYLFITHDLSVVETFANDVAVMSKGKIVDLGATDRVFANPASRYTRDLLAAIPRLKVPESEPTAATITELAPTTSLAQGED